MNLPKNRWLAFASHFGVSLLIFVVLLLIIVCLWYPGALFAAAGGWQGIRIVIGVDLVLGPLLTLIVYDRTKSDRVLWRDLAVIALIQLSCLAAGVFIVHDERPVAVTYAYDKFYVLKHSDFVKTGVDPATLDLAMMTPKVYYTDLAGLSRQTGIDRKMIANLYEMTGKDLSTKTDLYAPVPFDREAAAAVFADNKLPRYAEYGETCVTVALVSAFDKGIACYDPETQLFRKFVGFKDLGKEYKTRIE
jgi:hypothetical protein